MFTDASFAVIQKKKKKTTKHPSIGEWINCGTPSKWNIIQLCEKKIRECFQAVE